MEPAGEDAEAEPVVLTRTESPRAIALRSAANAIRDAIERF